MSDISAAAVRQLRAMTNAGMMDCKRALTEAGGDLENAVDVLRKRGASSATKRAGRSANEGVIACYLRSDSQAGILVEVNCETDFVARNDTFKTFCEQIAKTLVEDPEADLEALRVEQVTRLGENIRVGRHRQMDVAGIGRVAAYIHTGAKIGVLVEVGAGKPETLEQEQFTQLVRDITLQIAAANPSVVRRNELDPDLVRREREIAEEQAKGKPPQAVDRIIQGKLEKFYQDVCLEDQGFIRCNGEITVGEHVGKVGKELEDELIVRRFFRFQVGEKS